MPKGAAKNPFFFFMVDWRSNEEAKGRTFPNGLNDVRTDPNCSKAWESLSKADKNYYINKSKDHKVAMQGGTVDKKNCLGESIKEVQERYRRDELYQQTMNEYIESITSMGVQHRNLDKLKFIFMHVNWFSARAINHYTSEYYPAEFAVSIFSLENGTESLYHEIINFQVPIGYTREALEHSQHSHQIPLQYEQGANNFSVMYDKLVTFLKPTMTGNKFPPIFTTDEVKRALGSLLNRMAAAAKADRDQFLIYSVETLFWALRNAAVEQSGEGISIPLVVARNEFGKDIFCYERGIECSFHKRIDSTSQFCSKSAVQRWGYTICDHCCEPLNIELIPGIHLPLKPDIESLDLDINRLTLQPVRHELLSSTGVSQDHIIKRSERSYKDELIRRSQSKPLEIIDHSKLNQTSESVVAEKTNSYLPLRPPKSKSYAMTGMPDKNPAIINEADFPTMGGRGIVHKKKTNDIRIPLGRGRSEKL